MSTLPQHLERWADAREDRNTPGGHGATGTALLRDAAARIKELEGRLKLACEPCAECGHIDYRELDDILGPRAADSPERSEVGQ